MNNLKTDNFVFSRHSNRRGYGFWSQAEGNFAIVQTAPIGDPKASFIPCIRRDDGTMKGLTKGFGNLDRAIEYLNSCNPVSGRKMRDPETFNTSGLLKAEDTIAGVQRVVFPTFRIDLVDSQEIDRRAHLEGVDRAVFMRKLIKTALYD
jgi:hypothetical protein